MKAHLALHQVYGVDLNATAVELAEISLWLDTMVDGLQAPWFGLHLRRGNSLIGARRAVYTRDQVNDKQWLDMPPTDVPLTDLAQRVADDDPVRPMPVDASTTSCCPPRAGAPRPSRKEAKDLAPERAERGEGAGAARSRGKPTKTAGRRSGRARPSGRGAVAAWRYRRLQIAEAAESGAPSRSGARDREPARRHGDPRADRGIARTTPTAPTAACAG